MSDKLISECTDEELFTAFVERVRRLEPTVAVDRNALLSFARSYRVEGWMRTTVDLKADFSASGRLLHLTSH